MAEILSVSAASVDRAAADLARVREEIGRVIVGQNEVIEGVLICLIAGGHVLLEGVPGSRENHPAPDPGARPGSAIFADSIHSGSDARRHRGQRHHGTTNTAGRPSGSSRARSSRISSSPMRSIAQRPKTQSALLEAMQERTVTSGNNTYSLEAPFLVMATQNPIEMEGTYPLPEAQLDRFLMKILVTFPSRSDLSRIVGSYDGNDEAALRQVLDA